jgi:hypothetical protein
MIDCGPINDIFKESEQYVDKEVIKKQFKVANAYWGRVPGDGMWPLHVGARIKKTRLSAYGFGNHDVGWEPIDDAICESDLCTDPEVDRLQHGGFESIFYGPERFRINSDWICLDKLLFREIPEDEIAHYERMLVRATRYFWEEFYRSRYIDACENKVLALVPAALLDGDSCACAVSNICKPEINTSNGFVWARRSTGTIDERYIYVNCRVEDIERISDFGLDMLDIAKIELSAEDDNMPFLDDGVMLFDVVIGDPRQNIRFGETENHLMDRAQSYGGYDSRDLRRLIGTQRIWRDSYSIRYDNGSARFYPDAAYNEALDQGGAVIYDPLDPETWPRFIRVFPWKPQRIAVTSPVDGSTSFGIKHVKNKSYIYAPFVINTVFSKQVISSLGVGTAQSIGSAKLSDSSKHKTHDGVAKWINPPWPCNPYGEKGYYSLGFAAAIKPEYPEYGWAFLTRMDHSVSLRAVLCTIGQPECNKRISAYCYEGLAGDDADLNGSPGAARSVAINNYSYNGW